MTITRNVGGSTRQLPITMEFELTADELYNAYREQQFLFDRADIEDQFEMSDEDCIECYGIRKKEAESLFDDMAVEMRRNIDKYDMSWEYARDEAVREILSHELL